MTLFFICAALLVALCIAWLLLGMFRQNNSSLDQESVNIALARARGETLSAALADGSIDQATYDYEKEQLDYDLAAELTLDEQTKTKKSGSIGAAILVSAFVPIAAGALYLQLGNPGAITQDPSQVPASSSRNAADNANTGATGPLADLLPQLEERLAAEPGDVQGWRLLGRSYLSIQEYSKARTAFEKAVELEVDDFATLTSLAESIAMERGGDLNGEPMALLTRSLELNPRHEHTLWLMSIGQQQAGDHQAALRGFNLLMGLAKDNLDAMATIDQMRSRSIQALGADSVKQANTDSDQPQTDANVGGIEVRVSLNDEAQAAALPEQSVFIYATATTGPPMPLAVARLSVQDLPAIVVLDDSMAMIPTMKLSAFDDVTVGARISVSGNPIAQTGDWFTETENVKVANTPNIELVIDRVTP